MRQTDGTVITGMRYCLAAAAAGRGRTEETTLLDLFGTWSILRFDRYFRWTPKAVRSKLQRTEAPLEDLAGFSWKDLLNWLNVTSRPTTGLRIARWLALPGSG